MKAVFFIVFLAFIEFFPLHGMEIPLPDSSWDITFQRLEIYINPATTGIRGKQTFHFISRQPSPDTIVVFLHDSLSIDSVVQRSSRLRFDRLPSSLRVVIHLPAMEKGKYDSLSIYYHGNPPDPSFYGYFRKSHNDIPEAWTLSEPFGIPYWMPSKMDLYDKIDSLDMWIFTPVLYRAASNGLLISETIVNDSLRVAYWKHRYPIMPYLIAVAVTNYVDYTDTIPLRGKKLPMVNYVYPESFETVRKLTPALIPVMQFFDSIFIPYPFSGEKYGHAQVSLSGAMENQTMTFTVSFDNDLLTHELAHHWFGNYITCASWNDIWINEGFATWCTGLAHEHGLLKGTFSDWLKKTMLRSMLNDSGSVYVPDPTNPYRTFDYNLTYCKGAMLLHMLRWITGDQAFFAGIRNYLQDTSLAYGVDSVKDFKKHMEKTSAKNLDEFFNDWYYGRGFPKYSFQWQQSKKEEGVLILYQIPSHPSVSFFEMPVEIKFEGTDSDTTIVFDHHYSGERFTIAPGFYVKKIIPDPGWHIVTPHDTVWTNIPLVADSVKVYPNPAHEFVEIEIPPGSLLQEYRLYNESGQEIKTNYNIKAVNHYCIDVSSLAQNTYLLIIKVSDNTVRKKFVKR